MEPDKERALEAMRAVCAEQARLDDARSPLLAVEGHVPVIEPPR